jgi:hypothetical protein
VRRLLPVLLLLASVLVALAAFEGVARLFVRPSGIGWGTLRGRELPPRRLVPQPTSPELDPDAATPQRAEDGTPLTQGDLYGVFREDAEIGFTWEPSRASRHGWWRSNALGARADAETPREVPPGRRRVLVFGDSFAAGTRLPGPATWPAALGRLRPDLEVVNFGVDGYGTGQAYLLFRRVREQLGWDEALFLLVPGQDLWRDVNVSRFVGDGWATYVPMPRFVLDGEGVRLVPGPYPRGTMVYARDWPEASPALRQHLRAHDRFYDPLLYESPPVVGRLVSWKLLALAAGERRRAARRAEVENDLDGEAFTLCQRLLLRAAGEARSAGKQLRVAMLPSEAETEALRGRAEGGRWRERLRRLRDAGLEVVDLAPALLAGELDHGADGTHYGPRASARIAAALAQGRGGD